MTTPDPRDMLTEILGRCEGATGGPWWSYLSESGAVLAGTREGGMDEGPTLAYSDDYDADTFAFIAAARTDLPLVTKALMAVLDELDELDDDAKETYGLPDVATVSTADIRRTITNILSKEES